MGLGMHKGIKNYMANFATDEEIIIGDREIERVEYNTLTKKNEVKHVKELFEGRKNEMDKSWRICFGNKRYLCNKIFPCHSERSNVIKVSFQQKCTDHKYGR